MYKELSINVVIPAYNEEEGLASVLPTVPDIVDEIIVVDNNSTDKTSEVAKGLGARVVKETIQGYGAAYKAGFKAADKDIIATCDADGTYPIRIIQSMLDIMVEEKLDFISCSRFPMTNPEAMSSRNQMGNKVLTFTTNVLFGLNLSDSQSGMWVFKRSILDKIKLTSNGMPLSQELKIEAFTNPEINAKEVHIVYEPRIGDVKLLAWRDGFRNLFFLFQKKLLPGSL